jgi:tetratricopeptide (TPR) repeat protein
MMNKELQKYVNLRDQLLISNSGQEPDILIDNLHLLDHYFVELLSQETEIIKNKGDFNNLYRCQNLTRILKTAQGNYLTVFNRKIDADQYFHKGYLQEQTHLFSEALSSWQEALKIYREIADFLAEAITLNNMGFIHHCLGESQHAMECYQLSLARSREIEYPLGEANSLVNLGIVYDLLDSQESAISCYQQSLAIYRRLNHRQGEGICLHNLGLLYYSQGQYQDAMPGGLNEAIAYYQQSLLIKEEIVDHQGKSLCLGGLGNASYAITEYQNSIEFYQQQLEMIEFFGDAQAQAKTLRKIGLAYDALGLSENAIGYYQKSLQISQEIGYPLEAKYELKNPNLIPPLIHQE